MAAEKPQAEMEFAMSEKMSAVRRLWRIQTQGDCAGRDPYVFRNGLYGCTDDGVVIDDDGNPVGLDHLRQDARYVVLPVEQPPRAGFELVPVCSLKPGDLLDLQADPFADPDGDNPFLECLFAEVDTVYPETTAGVLLTYSGVGGVGMPRNHQVYRLINRNISPE